MNENENMFAAEKEMTPGRLIDCRANLSGLASFLFPRSSEYFKLRKQANPGNRWGRDFSFGFNNQGEVAIR